MNIIILYIDTHLKWYALSTSSIWWMASCRWFAASWICWSFHGDSGLMVVRCVTFCVRWTSKQISLTKWNGTIWKENNFLHLLIYAFKQKNRTHTACEMWSPDSVTKHFNWFCVTLNKNWSCLRPSFPYKGTGNRWAQFWKKNWNCIQPLMVRNMNVKIVWI